MQFLVHRQHQKERWVITIMGWFHLLWTILFAVSVSCQNLTTLFPKNDDACMRSEVTFSCTVRGSLTLTDLILAWSSPEYLGQGTPLRFTTQDTPGANKMSMINENVTATLISKTGINGVPELVSELHVIDASQTSMITCASESNQTSMSTTFVGSGFPGRPRNGEARERSPGSCDFLVTWDRPANVGRFDIDRYIIYVPSQNMMNVSSLTRIDLNIMNCRVDNNSIQVAAVNHFGCVGPNSSHINLILLEIMQDESSGGLSPGAVAGIVVGVTVVVFTFVIIPTLVLVIVFTVKKQNEKEEFKLNLYYLYEALKTDSIPSMKAAIDDLLRLDKTLSPSSIKEVLKYVLEKDTPSAGGLQIFLGRIKKRIPDVMSDFEAQLKKVGSYISMDNLNKAAQKGNHKTLFKELKEKVGKASPEDVQTHLRTLFKKLQESMNDEAEDELEKIFDTLEEAFLYCKMPHAKIKEILVDATKKLQKDTEESASSSRKEVADLKSEKEALVQEIYALKSKKEALMKDTEESASSSRKGRQQPSSSAEESKKKGHVVGGLPIYENANQETFAVTVEDTF